MNRALENELQVAIVELYEKGWVEIAEWRLYAWYEAQRLSRTVWRDINTRFQDYAESRTDKKFKVLKCDGPYTFLFICVPAEQVTLTGDGWFQIVGDQE